MCGVPYVAGQQSVTPASLITNSAFRIAPVLAQNLNLLDRLDVDARTSSVAA